jgi:hypothetical protein
MTNNSTNDAIVFPDPEVSIPKALFLAINPETSLPQR